MTDNTVQKQWGGPSTVTTALSVSERMFSLLRATTQDDVQTLALVRFPVAHGLFRLTAFDF